MKINTVLIAVAVFFTHVSFVSLNALTIQNLSKKSLTIVIQRKNKKNLEVITELKVNATSSEIAHHEVANGKDVHAVEYIYVFAGVAGEENSVPVSPFPINKLPKSGRFKFGVPEDVAYVVMQEEKNNETIYTLHGATLDKQRSRKQIRFFKVIQKEDKSYGFGKKQTHSVRKKKKGLQDDD